MQLSPENLKFLEQVYNAIKFWGPFVGAGWSVYKVINWAKDIRSKDLPEIKQSVAQIHSELQTQTSSVVNELKELRADMRTYYVPVKSYARAKKPAKR